jgi:hypothetical protein
MAVIAFREQTFNNADSVQSPPPTLSPGRLEGEAKVLKRGRALAFLEARVTDNDAVIAMSASSTWAASRR